jgi:hypothetical protein
VTGTESTGSLEFSQGHLWLKSSSGHLSQPRIGHKWLKIAQLGSLDFSVWKGHRLSIVPSEPGLGWEAEQSAHSLSFWEETSFIALIFLLVTSQGDISIAKYQAI